MERVKSLADDPSVFDVISYADLFQNLKAAIKQAASERAVSDILYRYTDFRGGDAGHH